MSVYFKCKTCHQEHPSPLFFADATTFDSTKLESVNLVCPATGRSAPYEKRDLWWVRDFPQRMEGWHRRRPQLRFFGMTVAAG